MKVSGPARKAKSRIAFTSTDDKIKVSQDIAAKPVSKPNFLAKHVFVYYKHTQDGTDTYYKINKSSAAKRLEISKKQIKNGVLDQKSMQILLVSTPKYQNAKTEADQTAAADLAAVNEKAEAKKAAALQEKQSKIKSSERAFASAVEASKIEGPASEGVEEVKQREFDTSLSNFFSGVPPAPGSGEIVVTGHVLHDGQGDYFHIRSQARLLEKQYPNRNVRIIVLAEQNADNTVKLTPPKGKEDTIIAYGRNYFGFPDAVASEAHKAINNAALVVSGPVSLDLTSQANWPITGKLKDSGIRVTEYDWQAASHPGYAKNLILGLSSSKTGGIIRPTPKEYKWSELESENLKQVLFENKQKPGKDTNIFFAYTGPEVTPKFIHHSVALSSKDKKDITIVSPSRVPVTTDDLEEYKDQWRSLGVGSVVIASFKNGVRHEETVKLSDAGKQLTIVNSGPIPSKDFKVLTKLSGSLMACTGDKSIEKALLYGKVPVYDVRPHKATFYGGLLREMKDRLGPESYLYRYCSRQGYFSGPEAEEASRILAEHSKELIAEAEAFGPQLLEARSANNAALSLANKQLYLNEYPELRELEKSCQSKYLKGEMSLEAVKMKFSEKMTELGLPTAK
ncbi:MAG: hypothetical protein Q8K75_11340 [Chlamydiales bacterium]|nr:hypothetical protein [Chlamydiales bacterium]